MAERRYQGEAPYRDLPTHTPRQSFRLPADTLARLEAVRLRLEAMHGRPCNRTEALVWCVARAAEGAPQNGTAKRRKV